MSLDFKRIKEVSLIDVAKRYGIVLTVKGEWANGVCKLPTHKDGDKGKNFSVNVRGNFWRCFSQSCNEANGGKRGGDVINFVALMENCTEKDAAQKLVDWYHLAEPKHEKAPTRIEKGPVVPPVSGDTHATDYKQPSTSTGESKSRYMQEVDAWFDITFKRIPEESDEGYTKRIRNAIKGKLIESFKSGKAAQEAKAA